MKINRYDYLRQYAQTPDSQLLESFSKLCDPDSDVYNLTEAEAKSVVGKLLVEMGSGDQERRRVASTILGSIDTKVMPILTSFLFDPDTDIRKNTARTLLYLGGEEDALEILPALIQGLSDPDMEVAAIIANAINRMGKRAVPALQKALESPDEDTRRFARIILDWIGHREEVGAYRWREDKSDE